MLTADATFDLDHAATFSVIRLREAIQFGQRIDSAAVEKWNGQTWETLASVTSIGPRRLVRLDKPVTAQRLRLKVTEASASPALTEFSVFLER